MTRSFVPLPEPGISRQSPKGYWDTILGVPKQLYLILRLNFGAVNSLMTSVK